MADKKKRIRRTPAQIEADKIAALRAKEVAVLTTQEVYDHVRIRKEARDRVPGALDVLDKIMHFDTFELRIRAEEKKYIIGVLSGLGCDQEIISALEADEGEGLRDNKTNPTISQMLDAAKIVFERAGDRPATAPPSDDGVVFDYLQMNSDVLPAIPNGN